MPELPEVETVAADLRPELIGKRIADVRILWPRTLAEPDPVSLAAQLPGQRVLDIGRRGKYILFTLDSGSFLIIHLRMTGKLIIVPADSSALEGVHVRAWFALSDGRRLVFDDARKFGRIWFVQHLEQVTGNLGPEPLDREFTPEALAGRLCNRRVAAKALLLDQTVVAGLGNIYADEALFLAGIHPLRRGSTLNADEIRRLHDAIRQVLGESLMQRGTMLRDYRTPYGLQGAYQNHFRVYQQTDRPCPHCGTPIRRIRVTQRSTHFCPSCQPSPELD